MEGLVNYSSEDDQDEQSSDHVAERGTPAKSRPTSYRARADDSPPAVTSTEHNTSSQRTNSSTASTAPRKRRSSSHGRERERERANHTREEEANTQQRHSKHSNGNRYGSSSRYRDESATTKDFKDTKGSREHHRDSKGDRKRSKDHKSEHRRRDSERDRGSKLSSSSAKGRHNEDRHERHKEFSHSKQHRDRKQRHERHSRRDRSAERHSRRSKEAPKSRSHSPSHSSHSRSGSPPARPHAKQQQSRKTPHSRSQTPVRSRSGSREVPAKPLEKARLTALEMEKKIKVSSNESSADGYAAPDAAHPSPVPARPIVPLMSLPLSDHAPKLPHLIAITSSSGVGGGAQTTRPQTEPSVIQLPSYYNPNAINATKYAEQVQKRKLIWGAKKAEDTAAKWGNAQFSEDSDGKVASKFMRLMGIKGAGAPKPPEAAKPVSAAPDVKSREAMFSNMEQQYEVARQTTHTMRGVGLGFGSQARPF